MRYAICARRSLNWTNIFAGTGANSPLPSIRRVPILPCGLGRGGACALGETRSYGEIAWAIGSPAAIRAVGAANGANPVAPFVPCHRIVGSDGGLTGYGPGLPLKARLLAMEGAIPSDCGVL